MKRVCVKWGMGMGLAAASCRVVVDQPPTPQPYAYSYQAPPYSTAYAARTYPARTYPTASYPAASSTAGPRPPPPQATTSQAAPRLERVSSLDDAPRRNVRAGATAPACLDATSSSELPDCGLVRRAPARCSLETTPQQRCTGYRTYFDPKVAASAISCLSSLTGRELCDAARASDCAKIALAEACLDASVDQLCQVAEGPCKTTASVCAATLSGLNDQGQQWVAECVAHGCQGGIDGCLDALTSGHAPTGSTSHPAPSSTLEE